MLSMGDEKKPNLFDKLKSAVDQAIVAGGPVTGGVKKPRPVESAAGADKGKWTSEFTGQGKKTAELSDGKGTTRLQGPPDEQLSPRRLAMIDDYMRGEAKIEQMNDPAYMYKVVSDERAYQTRLLIDFRRQFAQLGQTTGPDAELLQNKIRRSQAIVQNLFKVLKRITGTKGSTGGTDFLSDKK